MQRNAQFSIGEILSYLAMIALETTYLLVKAVVELSIKGYQNIEIFITNQAKKIKEKQKKKKKRKQQYSIKKKKIKRIKRKKQIIEKKKIQHIRKIKSKRQVLKDDNNRIVRTEEFVPIGPKKAKALVTAQNSYKNTNKNAYIKKINIIEENLQILEYQITLTQNKDERQRLQNQATFYQFQVQDTILQYQKTLTKNTKTYRKR